MVIGKAQRTNTGGESIDMDLYIASPNLMFGKTSVGFGASKGGNRVGTQIGARIATNSGSPSKNSDYQMQQPNTVRTNSSNYNGAPPATGNLNFSLNANHTIVILLSVILGTTATMAITRLIKAQSFSRGRRQLSTLTKC
jgi:hypothetical protein